MNVPPLEILVVDDNDDDVLMIRKSFESSKLINVVQVARDGEKALALLRGDDKSANGKLPGLILLDINMPKKNGFEVLEEIKADPDLRHIPVVMLTTSAREEDIVKSYANGAPSFISKPVHFAKLKELVDRFSLYWALVAKLPATNR